MASGISILINGRSGATVPWDDRGLQYGDGLFETIAVRRGEPLRWQDHLRRLQRGCARLAIEPAPAPELLAAEADALCRGRGRAVLKITVTRGPSARGYGRPPQAAPTRILARLPWPGYPQSWSRQGVSVRLCRTPLGRNPTLAGIKHLNRLEQVLARSEWETEFAEGLMRDDRGDIIEGTHSNLFVVAGDTLYTPDLSECGVAGIMRDAVLREARAAGHPVRIERLGLVDVLDADELFLTNSLIGLWPVRRLDRREYAIGSLTRKLQQRIAV